MIDIVSAAEAVGPVRDGQIVMVGGFGLVGQPLALVDALGDRNLRDLTIISNNIGEPGRGLGAMLRQGALSTVIGSYFTSNPEVGEAYANGDVHVRLVPQGTLAEAIRAGGAGIPAFFTPTAVGTELAAGKDTMTFDGRECVLERALHADVALLAAHTADRYGNLAYRKTARNFNPLMATAARYVVAQVSHVVDTFEDHERPVTPHNFVDAVVHIPEVEG